MANKKTRKRWTGYSIYGAETEKEYQSKLNGILENAMNSTIRYNLILL